MRSFTRSLASVGALLAALAGCTSHPRTLDPSLPPPNIVLFTLDTVRADHIGAYGHAYAETRNIDRLAAEGVVFTRAWTVAPLTAPSHASMLTGLYPSSHGVRNNQGYALSDRATTLAEILKDRGYRTGAFVAALPLERMYGFHQGFDVYDDEFGYDPRGVPRSERRAEEVNARALPWIRDAVSDSGEQPFFAWVHYFDPHAPYAPPPELRKRFASRRYDGEIAWADLQLGKVLDELTRETGGRDTIVIVVADHGEQMGHHGEQFHGILAYEPVLHVPLILHAPARLGRPRRDDRLVSVVDILPTVLTAAGFEVPPTAQGQDVSGLSEAASVATAPDADMPAELSGILAAAGENRVVFAESHLPWEAFGWSALFAARRGDAKWISASTPEFYDLSSDPGEQVNLSDDSDRRGDLPEIVSKVIPLLEQSGLESTLQMSASDLERLQSLGYAGGASQQAGTSLEVRQSGPAPSAQMEDYRRYQEAQVHLYRDPGNCPLALTLLTIVSRTQPHAPEMWRELAMAQECVKNFEAAEATHRGIVERFPGFHGAAHGLVRFLKRRDRKEDAVAFILELKERDPEYRALDATLVQFWIDLGENAKALSFAERYLRDRPGDVHMRALRGQALLEEGREEESLAIFRDVLRSTPAERAAWEPAVRLLESRGEEDSATELIRTCLREVPADPALRAALAERKTTAASESGP